MLSGKVQLKVPQIMYSLQLLPALSYTQTEVINLSLVLASHRQNPPTCLLC